MTEPRVLGGRYQVGEILGVGGMAEVHLGRDLRIGRPVAVKLLRADLAGDPAFQARFQREAQSAASLSHPSIVAVYDTGDDGAGADRTPYIVMEYVDGRTLREILHAEGRLLPGRALEVTAEVLRALEYSHQRGIVHRDVKPGNVMLTPNGDVKVMDFGIARAVTASAATMTQTAAIIGTAHYLSPEQARGDHVDARSDIYSTGCLLYELLTGSPPFTGESPVAVAYQHVREDAVPPSQIEPELAPAVDAVVLKALAKNPANRYQSAEEMRADIERVLAGKQPLAAPVEEETAAAAVPPTTVVLRRPEPSPGRRTAAYVALGVAALAVFVVAAFLVRALVSSNGTAEVNTPDVTGHTMQQAEALLAERGLHVGDVKLQFDPHPKNTVINQSPLPDILLRKGDAVDLVVSKGIEYVQVPPLVGLSRDGAATNLKLAKLTLGTVTEQASDAPAGQVLSSTPAPGATVPAGTAVDLVVSNGTVQVPSVVGMTVSAATTALLQAGFQVFPTDLPPDAQVLSQNPAAGSFAKRGSTVTLTTNAPTPTPTPSESGTPTPSETPSTEPSQTPTVSPTVLPSPGG